VNVAFFPVRDTRVAFLESHAAFTRSGTNGVAQVDTTGFIAAAFTHRDSRAGDPDLHTHVAISNKVATIDANGVQRWLALDGQPLHRTTVAASELYNTRIEAHTAHRLAALGLGVQFADVPAGRGKRPVREIVGMSNELLEHFSSRRAAIETRAAELSKQFQATHGTAANPPQSKRSPWPNRPPWNHAKPNTSRDRWPNSARPGGPRPSRS
jgi:conjugative relaxase-like TrwC/TraI family protein